MDDPAHTTGPAVELRHRAPVPTARQTLMRTVPASVLLLAGPPLLTWWLVDVPGRKADWWWLLALSTCFGLALLVQRIAQAPRSRLAKRSARRVLDQWLRFTAKEGVLPEDPHTRTAAGTLACYGLEAELATAAMAAGLVLSVILASTLPWTTAMVPVLMTAMYFPRARRSWRYLKVLHAPSAAG